MKLLMLLGVCLVSGVVLAAEAPKLVQLWETKPVLKVPEGVHFDRDRNVLYVSNIDGKEPWAKDGQGSIARVSLEGEVLEPEWITGLHAPKGIGRFGLRLYVADVDQLVAIDLQAGRIVRHFDVPGAQRLNDVTVDANGVVYVSDSATGHIYQLQRGEVSVFSRAFKNPNGVLAGKTGLYVLDQETLFKVAPGHEPEVIARGIEGHVDGVEQDGDNFIVTCWEGIIYFVTPAGDVTKLLDTRDQKVNAADPGFDPERRILYVPTFWKNTVVAYQLK